jgi:hypothetical protein
VLTLLALPLGALIGFVASRRLRRPQQAAQAAAVARTVSGSLGARKGLSAPELQRACYSEMIRHVRKGPDGVDVVPQRFLLRLHPEDLAVVDDARGWFSDGLSAAFADAARAASWSIELPLDLRYEADPSRRRGVPSALAVDPRPAPTSPRTEPSAPTGLALVADGHRTVLGEDPVVIGRASVSDLVIDDTRVSRHHATVARGRGGWVLTDAGSSNGTSVNGRLLSPNVPHVLRAGDLIGIGPTELRVERVSPR